MYACCGGWMMSPLWSDWLGLLISTPPVWPSPCVAAHALCGCARLACGWLLGGLVPGWPVVAALGLHERAWVRHVCMCGLGREYRHCAVGVCKWCWRTILYCRHPLILLGPPRRPQSVAGWVQGERHGCPWGPILCRAEGQGQTRIRLWRC